LGKNRLGGRLRTQQRGTRHFWYSREDLQTITGRRPEIPGLTNAAATRYCEDVHKVRIPSSRLHSLVRFGLVSRDGRFFSVSDLDAVCTAPLHSKGRWYDSTGKPYITEEKARELFGNTTQWTWRNKGCPILGRKTNAKLVPMRVTRSSSRYGALSCLRNAWVYSEEEQAHIFKLKTAAREERRGRELMVGLGNGREAAGDVFLSYREIFEQYGWSKDVLVRHEERGGPLLPGRRRLRPILQLRDIGRITRIKVLPKRVCEEMKAAEMRLEQDAVGYTPLTVAAKRWNVSANAAARWCVNECPYTGKPLGAVKKWAKDAQGRWRKQAHCLDGKVKLVCEKIRERDAAGHTPVPVAAQHWGVSRETAYNWAKGRKCPYTVEPLKAVKKWAKVLQGYWRRILHFPDEVVELIYGKIHETPPAASATQQTPAPSPAPQASADNHAAASDASKTKQPPQPASPQTPTDDNQPAMPDSSDPVSLESLRETLPPSGTDNWVPNKTAAFLDGITTRSLTTYRSVGVQTDDHMLGRDRHGRIWRRFSTPSAHPWYLRCSLVSSRQQNQES